MTRRMLFPILMGLVGCAILVSLGVWQLQRMQWKEGILAEITARIGADPWPCHRHRPRPPMNTAPSP